MMPDQAMLILRDRTTRGSGGFAACHHKDSSVEVFVSDFDDEFAPHHDFVAGLRLEFAVLVLMFAAFLRFAGDSLHMRLPCRNR
jgi:hypothetical protein